MIRPAAPDDMDALFAIRNDPEAVRWSLSGAIRPADKSRWFATLRAHSPLFLVAEIKGQVCGYVIVDETACVSIAVASFCRKLGFGRGLLETAIERFPGDLRAIVHCRHVASLALFEGRGFKRTGDYAGPGGPWLVFERAK